MRFQRCGACVVLIAAAGVAILPGAALPETLRVLRDGYPRAFFFRSAEALAANPIYSYEQWEKMFSRLMGIEGKVLEEEVPGRSVRNIEFFTKYKLKFPEDLVLLHYNGNSRDPRDEGSRFFAGHWLYFTGAKILSGLPAEPGETELRVEDASRFKTNVGRFGNAHEDIGICELDSSGKPDWSRSEQVQLLSVDKAANTLRVRRAAFGTRPRAFAAGRSYAAAHVTEGPWSVWGHLMWFYNYSELCPRDAAGRVCADILAGDLARRFQPDGPLAAFDGVEFDVLMHAIYRPGGRGVDADGDGLTDRVQPADAAYARGMAAFCRKLRAMMGEQKLILADGWARSNQRITGLLNGIESEGWPSLFDHGLREWSSGLNRHWFWIQNGRAPRFSYVNHKFGGDIVGQPKPEISYNIHRLVFAASVMMDAAICYSNVPSAEEGEIIGIWDELRMGTEGRIGWLGQPLGPPVRMSERTANLLRDGPMVLNAGEARENDLRFQASIPAAGPDLFIKIRARGEQRSGYPPETPRMLSVRDRASKDPPLMTWINGREFDSGFYFPGIKDGQVDLELVVEGREPVSLSIVAAHAHPDAMYRLFEHGVVLANPAPHPYEFDLDTLVPGKKFRRLQGSPHQDPRTNDGSAVSGNVRLGAKDAFFLAML